MARFSGFQSLPQGDEKAFMEALATHGPIAIAYDASHVTMKWVGLGETPGGRITTGGKPSLVMTWFWEGEGGLGWR